MKLELSKAAHAEAIRKLRIAIISGAVVLGLVVLFEAHRQPRTDTGKLPAHSVGIAPEVEGPIVRLNVHDNQFVKKGELLFEIDERPYQYALENGLSQQAALEGQIGDERRRIAALVSGVSVAQANIQAAQADVVRWAAAVDQARADVANAEQGINRAKAEWTYSNNNLHRIEPLLAKQFVTADQGDRARTLETAQAEALKQASSQLQLSQAGLKSALAQYERSKAALGQSNEQHQQSVHAVNTLEPLTNQRGARTSAVQTAQYNFNNCKVYAPFDARTFRSEEHTSELQSHSDLVCRLLLEKKKKKKARHGRTYTPQIY